MDTVDTFWTVVIVAVCLTGVGLEMYKRWTRFLRRHRPSRPETVTPNIEILYEQERNAIAARIELYHQLLESQGQAIDDFGNRLRAWQTVTAQNFSRLAHRLAVLEGASPVPIDALPLLPPYVTKQHPKTDSKE